MANWVTHSRNALILFLGLFLVACNQDASDTTDTEASTEHAMTETPDATDTPDAAPASAAPDVGQRDHVMTQHGHTRNDEYYWIRDREDPAMLAYLEAENAYAGEFFDPLADLQNSIFEEIIGHLSETRESVPYTRNGYVYTTRFNEGADYSVISRAPVGGGEEEVVINSPALAEGHDYFMMSDWDISPSNTMLAYSIDTNGRELYDVTIQNLETGEILENEIAAVDGSLVFSEDGSSIYYVKNDPETLRPYQLWRHRIGTPSEEDQMLYQEDDTEYLLYMYRTKSDRYLALISYLNSSTETRLVDLSDPEAEPVLFEERRMPHEYYVEHIGDTFFIRSDENAMNYQVFSATDEGGHPGEWQLVVPHRDDTLVESMEVFDGYLALDERSGGSVAVRVYDLVAGTDHRIDVGGDVGYASASGGASDIVNVDANTTTVRFSYSSYNSPTTVYDYDMSSRELSLMRQDEVRGDYDASNYETARVWATAQDGTQIPVTLAWRSDMGGDGPRPLMLRGYASYGSSYDPQFTYAWLPLMDHGIILATAHVRGGQEMGRQWHYDGRLLNKINTFTDFIDVGDYLVAEGWTTSDTMMARGGSAGGLLLGAVANMRPDLFHGILNHVPFVDVVTTMSDPTIPLTTYEWVEWGNPADEEYYHYMLSYSPYDQVGAMDYPHMFVTAGLNDPRVQYWEPTKYVARLRDHSTSDNLLIYKVNMGSGHFGTTGRFSAYEDVAREYVFMLSILGMTGEE